MNQLHIVSVSGGKDSTALYLWAIERFGRHGFKAVFADTCHEHPVTYNYLRNLPAMAKGAADPLGQSRFPRSAQREIQYRSGSQREPAALYRS